MHAARGLKSDTWKQVCKQAQKYIGKYKKIDRYAPNYVNRTLVGHTGRAVIIDESENEGEDENMGEDEDGSGSMGEDLDGDDAEY